MADQILTNSRRNSFGTCHRRHYFEYELGARPVQDAESLRFGTLIHLGLEAWFHGLHQGPDTAYRDAIAAITANAPAQEADAYQQFTALAMMEGYHLRWHGEILTTLAVEQEFRIPLINPDTLGQSRTWDLSGKIDAIVERDGRALIVEHKTTSYDLSPESSYWTRLAIDGQVSGYYQGAKSLGYDVAGCLYDVLRKPSMRPGSIPLVDESGVKIVLDANGDRVRTKDGKKWRETGDSKEGYTLQTRPETPEEWYERLRADIAAQPEKYFRRLEVPRLDADLVEYMSDMWAVGREIADAQKSGRWPRHTRSCDSYGGCPYMDVCAGRESIDNPIRFQRVGIHRELSTNSQESF